MMRPAAPGLRRTLLKAATHAAHCNLDRLIGALDLGEPRQYRQFLEASASALLPLERLLARSAVSDVLSDWPQRARSTLINADLLALAGNARELALDRQSLSAVQVTGVLYVLEGSRLGARIIARQLPRDCTASRYLTDGDPALWRIFLERLEAADAPWDPLTTVNAARWAFAVFQRAFAALVERHSEARRAPDTSHG